MYKKYRVKFEDMCENETFIGVVEILDDYDEYYVINDALRKLVGEYDEDDDEYSSLEEYLYMNYQYVDGVTDFWVERRPLIDFTIEW